MTIINVGRGFTSAQYWIAPEVHGRYPRDLVDFNRANGGMSYAAILESSDVRTVQVASLYGKTRMGHGVEFSDVEFLKVRDGVYTFTACISKAALVPRLLRRYTHRDDLYVSGSLKVDITADDIILRDFKDVKFYGVGKKAMNFIHGTELFGYSLNTRLVNLKKK